MKLVPIVILLASSLGAQVFNNLSPNIKGVTIGTTHCYFWHLTSGGLYDYESACYTNNLIKSVHAKVPGSILVGSFPYIDGIITWTIKSDGTYDIAARGTSEVHWTGSF